MYAREVDGKTLTFQVSGMLWGRSLVMRDLQTKSLWSHITGECKRGKLMGKQLEQFPSVMTDWVSWKAKYPDTTVTLPERSAFVYVRDVYRQRPREEFVLGLVQDGNPIAWRFDFLERNPVHQEQMKDVPVLVTFDQSTFTARAFDRRVDKQVLEFSRKAGMLTDQSGTTWDPFTGDSLEGPMKGKSLTPLPAILSFTEVWQRFHFDTKIVTGMQE